QDIASRCEELDVPIVMRFPAKIPLDLLTQENADPSVLPPAAFSTPRERYQLAVRYLATCLNARILEAMRRPRSEPAEFQKASQLFGPALAESSRIKKQLDDLQARLRSLPDRAGEREQINDEVFHIKAMIEELQHLPSLQVLTLTEPIFERTLNFMRRWEE